MDKFYEVVAINKSLSKQNFLKNFLVLMLSILALLFIIKKDNYYEIVPINKSF